VPSVEPLQKISFSWLSFIGRIEAKDGAKLLEEYERKERPLTIPVWKTSRLIVDFARNPEITKKLVGLHGSSKNTAQKKKQSTSKRPPTTVMAGNLSH
jgi:hypothetical protein